MWRPKKGDKVWVITSKFKIEQWSFTDNIYMIRGVRECIIFKTRQEARNALKRIKEEVLEYRELVNGKTE